MDLEIVLGLLFPFLGTLIGASLVFFLKDKLNDKLQKILLGFASGVMIAASVWSLIMPSIEMSEDLSLPWLPAAIGFLLGVGFLLVLDTVIPHLHLNSNEVEGIVGKKSLKKSTMLVLAVTLHNIPEGMAVGVLFAGVLMGNSGMTIAGAMVLAIGIAIQNFPEGAIISMPLKSEGESKLKSFGYGVLSGIVEPISAIITILLTNIVVPILPYLLAFAAGAMMYVIVIELIPESNDKSKLNVIGFLIGFIIMMLLDVMLG